AEGSLTGAFGVLQVLPVAFYRDPNKLCSRANTGFIEKLLHECLHQRFRDSQLVGNLLVGTAAEHASENVSLTLCERVLHKLVTTFEGSHCCAHRRFFGFACAGHDLANLIDEQLRAFVLEENARAALLQQARSLEFADSRGYHQHLSCET